VTCAFIFKGNLTLIYKFKVIEDKLFGKKIHEFLFVENVTKRSLFKDSEDIWGLKMLKITIFLSNPPGFWKN